MFKSYFVHIKAWLKGQLISFPWEQSKDGIFREKQMAETKYPDLRQLKHKDMNPPISNFVACFPTNTLKFRILKRGRLEG